MADNNPGSLAHADDGAHRTLDVTAATRSTRSDFDTTILYIDY